MPSSWSWRYAFPAPKDVVFKESINALNSLGIKIEKIDEFNGVIEGKKKDMWRGNQDVKITVTPYEGGCTFETYIRQWQVLASGTCGETSVRISEKVLTAVKALGYGDAVDLTTAENEGKPVSLPTSQAQAPAQPQAQSPPPPPPPPPPPQAAQTCPTCGKPLTFIQQYNRWYCYNCKKYP